MLIPIENFPFGKQGLGNPMHEKLLLLELRGFGRHFTIGYYNAVMDVFCTWAYPGFRQTEDHRYDEIRLEDTELYCILPKGFMLQWGSRLIKGYVPLLDAVIAMNEHKMRIEDIDGYLQDNRYCVPHLFCTKDGHIIISEVGCFCDSGNQFMAVTPSEINGHIYHASGPVPRSSIHYVVDLSKLEYIETPKRMVDVDGLFEAITKNDLEYMQQNDIMDSIRDIMERYFREKSVK